MIVALTRQQFAVKQTVDFIDTLDELRNRPDLPTAARLEAPFPCCCRVFSQGNADRGVGFIGRVTRGNEPSHAVAGSWNDCQSLNNPIRLTVAFAYKWCDHS